MTIRKNIEEKIVQIQQEIAEEGENGGEVTQRIKQGAISAILGGPQEREAYFSNFAKTPAQLARLMPTDGTENDPEKREARAYLIANAVCAPATATGILGNVFDRLDTPPVE